MSFEDKRFCVYLHRRKDTNEVFYVGQGNSRRAFNKSTRSATWKQVAEDAGGFDIEIVESALTKAEAVHIENELITALAGSVINRLTDSSKVVPISYEDASKKFYYDVTSPSCLRHAVDVKYGNGYRFVRHKIGDPAGSLSNTGYYTVMVNGHRLKAHRIVYLLNHGNLKTTLIIDHIDRNRSNNEITNLRMVTASENNRNRSKRKDNTSGTIGVVYLKKADAYLAIFNHELTRSTKTYTSKKYGKDQALQLAIEWRKQKEKEYGFNRDSEGTP